MFGNLSHLALQHYWWAIVALLGALLVFLLFVQGGQTLFKTLGKTDNEVKLLVNSIGRRWDLTFTTLVTFGGAAFASFPLFYSTSFGGAYWVWILILFAFIIQAVSYEYRTKTNNFLGTKTFEAFLYANGLLATILLGTAVATFFTGSEFSVNMMNSSTWQSPFRGLELAFNFGRYATYINLSLGLAIFFLARVLAILYFMNNIDNDTIIERAKSKLLKNAVPFLVFFLFFLINILLIKGFAYNPDTKEVFMEPFKYLHNFLAMPVVLIVFLIGVVMVLWGIYRAAFNFETCKEKAIWFSGIGTVLTVFMLLLNVGFNNTSFYPSVANLQSSLTIENASSSHFTLTAMSYVSLLIPFVVAYIWYAWWAMTRTKINDAEFSEDEHSY